MVVVVVEVEVLPEQIVHVTQQEEEDGEFLNLKLEECLLQQELEERGAPHEDTGGEGEPLVVGDGLMDGVPQSEHSTFT